MANEKGKRAAAIEAARRVEDGQTIGLGTGSTAAFFLEALAVRVRDEGLWVEGIATSRASEALAARYDIPLVPLTPGTTPDLTIDGADEIGSHLTLIKGGGGALLREKLVASASTEMIVIADASKPVPKLGAFPLPVAVVPFAVDLLSDELRTRFEVPVTRRTLGDGTPFVSDDQLAILDLHFGFIPRPALLEKRLKLIVGIVETGLFVGIARRALIGHDDGRVDEWIAD
jgi:ribose 5-phosphate isomerase A